jgi:hypothetical protein
LVESLGTRAIFQADSGLEDLNFMGSYVCPTPGTATTRVTASAESATKIRFKFSLPKLSDSWKGIALLPGSVDL